MAGAQALGEFVSLDAAESFAIEYWPLELYKLAQAPPPGELQGQVALVTGGAGGIGRAIGDALAAAGACVVAFDLDQSGAEDAVAAYGDSGARGQRRRHQRGRGRGRLRGRRRPLRRRRHRRLERRHRLERGDRGDLAGRVEPQPRDPRARATSSSRARRSGSSASRAAAARSSSSPPRTRSSPARTRPPTRRPRPPSCTSRAASPRRAAPSGIRVNTVNPDAVLQGSRIWGSSWREERAAVLRHRARRARGALPQAHDAGGQHLPRGHRPGGAALRLAGAVGQEHRQPAQRGRRGAGGVRAVVAVLPANVNGGWVGGGRECLGRAHVVTFDGSFPDRMWLNAPPRRV